MSQLSHSDSQQAHSKFQVQIDDDEETANIGSAPGSSNQWTRAIQIASKKHDWYADQAAAIDQQISILHQRRVLLQRKMQQCQSVIQSMEAILHMDQRYQAMHNDPEHELAESLEDAANDLNFRRYSSRPSIGSCGTARRMSVAAPIHEQALPNYRNVAESNIEQPPRKRPRHSMDQGAPLRERFVGNQHVAEAAPVNFDPAQKHVQDAKQVRTLSRASSRQSEQESIRAKQQAPAAPRRPLTRQHRVAINRPIEQSILKPTTSVGRIGSAPDSSQRSSNSQSHRKANNL